MSVHENLYAVCENKCLVKLTPAEHGTWTPTLTGVNIENSTGFLAKGWYIKIGSIVMLGFNIHAESLSVDEGTTKIEIGGLPFNISYGLSGSGHLNSFGAGAQDVQFGAWYTLDKTVNGELKSVIRAAKAIKTDESGSTPSSYDVALTYSSQTSLFQASGTIMMICDVEDITTPDDERNGVVVNNVIAALPALSETITQPDVSTDSAIVALPMMAETITMPTTTISATAELGE